MHCKKLMLKNTFLKSLVFSACIIACSKKEVIDDPANIRARIDGQDWKAKDIYVTRDEFDGPSELVGVAGDGSKITVKYETIPSFSGDSENFRAQSMYQVVDFVSVRGNYDVDANVISIFWRTSSETEVSTFQVFVSNDNNNYQMLEEVSSLSGNSGEYEVFDRNDYYGMKFYKIAAINQNGESIVDSSVLVVFSNNYPVLFTSSSGYNSPGFNGIFTLEESFDGGISGTFNFQFKDRNDELIEVEDGTFMNVSIIP